MGLVYLTKTVVKGMESVMDKNMRLIAQDLEKTMQCNCDLDNYEPTKETGHSWVCRIHKETMAIYK